MYCWRVAGNAFWQQHGDAWARRSEHGLPNAAYDRPAILRLAGDVSGRRVLELGCAAGVLTGLLTDRGASVLALDREPRMAALARKRLGGRARVEVADVAQPLSGKADYHRTELISEQYDYDGQPVTLQMYRRPISAIFRQLRAAGFTVDVVDESQPEAVGEPGDPEEMHILQTQPIFLYIRALRA